MGTPVDVDIEEIDAGDDRILRLSGELDMAGVPMLEAAVAQACSRGPRTVTLDLSGLRFIDSTGLAAILRANGECTHNGCSFRLLPGPRSVQRLFEVTGLDGVLPFVEADQR